MKTLHMAIFKTGIITKIVSYKGKIFKMTYECTNGRNSLDTQIMNSDGEFKYILTKYDLGDKFEFVASYVSELWRKEKDAVQGFALMEALIKKLY